MMNHNLLFSLLLINAQLIVGQEKNIYEYLPKNTEYLIYHDDWGKNNYKKLLNQFNSDPLNSGEIIFLGNDINNTLLLKLYIFLLIAVLFALTIVPLLFRESWSL